jgi:Flp pilus assembly protein TadG
MRQRAVTALTFRWPRIIARFAGDRSGVSAVEFALLLPVMIALYLGGVEISTGVSIDRKVTLTAGTVANLTAQSTALVTSDVTNIMNASTAIIAPYSATGLKITVSCLGIDSTGKAKVSWSATMGGTVRSVGSVVTIPSALAVPSSQLVFSEVSYPYKPTVGYTISGTLTLSDVMYMSPRISAPTYNGTACS